MLQWGTGLELETRHNLSFTTYSKIGATADPS
jgi:hypothetical protein